jgi:hypothetical protein|nr:MAG TPA: hypothetical protein [Caudoviricetes sp.]
MIDLSLDLHDFVAAVEGFAYGSHLRQHVWRKIVFPHISQMTDDEMDFFWYIFRRNLWDCYFREVNGCMTKHSGHEDYLHTLAALHRGNRYKVTFQPDTFKQPITAECYRFAGRYRPLRIPGQESRMASFDSYVPREWIRDVVTYEMPHNKYVQEEWWTNLGVYDDKTLL